MPFVIYSSVSFCVCTMKLNLPHPVKSGLGMSSKPWRVMSAHSRLLPGSMIFCLLDFSRSDRWQRSNRHLAWWRPVHAAHMRLRSSLVRFLQNRFSLLSVPETLGKGLLILTPSDWICPRLQSCCLCVWSCDFRVRTEQKLSFCGAGCRGQKGPFGSIKSNTHGTPTCHVSIDLLTRPW